MSNIILYIITTIIIFITKLTPINSVVKYSIDINNESFKLDHDNINNTTETFESTNKNFYLCENQKDCISCSFLIYEFANCKWDCEHNRCLTNYNSVSFSAIVDLQEIYTQCTTCDEVSTEKMEKNCDSRILVNENSKELNVKDNNNDNDDDNNDDNNKANDIDYSKINFIGLLCKYNIFNEYSKSNSIFHLNITKYFRYINIYIELDYGLYSRHINLKTQKNYDIDTVGVNSIVIYVYTPHNYSTQPFSILYGFKQLKGDKVLYVIIILMAIIIFIFTILLILIFIEIYKGRIISHGRREYILGVNTLIFKQIKFYHNLFKKYNQKCFFCGKIIEEGDFISQMKCGKHINHYSCLLKWVRENMLDKTNFFCPICQNDQLNEITRSNISRDDNDNLLNSVNNNINLDDYNGEKEVKITKKVNKELFKNNLDDKKITDISSKEKEDENNNINNEIIEKSESSKDKKEDKNNDDKKIIISENSNSNDDNNINNSK